MSFKHQGFWNLARSPLARAKMNSSIPVQPRIQIYTVPKKEEREKETKQEINEEDIVRKKSDVSEIVPPVPILAYMFILYAETFIKLNKESLD